MLTVAAALADASEVADALALALALAAEAACALAAAAAAAEARAAGSAGSQHSPWMTDAPKGWAVREPVSNALALLHTISNRAHVARLSGLQ